MAQLSGVKVKGSGFAHTMEFIRKQYGKDALERVINALPDESRATIASAMPSFMYPVEYVGDFVAAMKKTLAPNDPDFIFRASVESSKATFSIVYKIFIRLGTPGFIIGKVSSVWSTLCTHGKLEVVEKSDKHLVIRLSDFPYRNTDYCDQRLRGWFQGALETSGCRITENIHTTCTSRGGAFCEWRIRWK